MKDPDIRDLEPGSLELRIHELEGEVARLKGLLDQAVALLNRKIIHNTNEIFDLEFRANEIESELHGDLGALEILRALPGYEEALEKISKEDVETGEGYIIEGVTLH